MMRWLRSLFAWRHVGDIGAWAYFENRVTGARKANRIAGIAGPRNGAWLRGEVSSLNHRPKRPPPPSRLRAS